MVSSDSHRILGQTQSGRRTVNNGANQYASLATALGEAYVQELPRIFTNRAGSIVILLKILFRER